jgi:putative Holliday junction resolvase
MRYLAIDYGQKRTGLAICDAHETLASPVTVITGQGGIIDKIAKVIRDEEIQAVVMGLPLNMDGTESSQTRRVRQFADQLTRNIDIPLHFQDERLSSFDAEQKLAGLGITRKKKKKHLDAVAAASILQTFLDKKHADSGWTA